MSHTAVVTDIRPGSGLVLKILSRRFVSNLFQEQARTQPINAIKKAPINFGAFVIQGVSS